MSVFVLSKRTEGNTRKKINFDLFQVKPELKSTLLLQNRINVYTFINKSSHK
jgi:hypothetical protein